MLETDIRPLLPSGAVCAEGFDELGAPSRDSYREICPGDWRNRRLPRRHRWPYGVVPPSPRGALRRDS